MRNLNLKCRQRVVLLQVNLPIDSSSPEAHEYFFRGIKPAQEIISKYHGQKMGKIARTHGGSLCAASSPGPFHGSGPLVDYFTATKLENPHCCQLCFALIVAGILAWRSFDDFLVQLYTYRQLTKYEPVIQYVKENTSPDGLFIDLPCTMRAAWMKG